MAGELLKSQGRVSAVHIPYAGAAPAQLGLLAGQTDFMFDNLASATAQIKAGKLKALAVTTPQRAPSMPEVPTMNESAWPVSTYRPGSVSLHLPARRPRGRPTQRNDDCRATHAGNARTAGANGSRTGTDVVGTVCRAGAQELTKYEKIVKFSDARVD